MEEKITKPVASIWVWILIVGGGLIAIGAGIYLGLGTAKRFEPLITDKLPKPTYVALPMTTSRPIPSEYLLDEPTSPPAPIDEGTYVLDFSNTRLVTSDDLVNLTPWELKVARNEIYARYGREFVHQDLSCYFDEQLWYQVDPSYADSKLSKMETVNATFILNYEKKINSPLINKDSGCDQNNL